VTLRVLAVPNWSFGRDSSLLRNFAEVIDLHGVRPYYLASDVDHNRTVSAFDGDHESVANVIVELCALAFSSIDLNRHIGVHPRIGALDVCPFIAPWGCEPDEMRSFVEIVAAEVAERFEVPVFLYEKSEKGRHEADLPSLRKGGFGALLDRELDPDFGPPQCHPRLGATVMGWRNFLIALNVDFESSDTVFVRKLARQVRALRADGDPRFLGVRALGLPLPSRAQSQLSFNLTLPDLTPVDPVIEWVYEQAVAQNVRLIGPELIGVIRDVDMEHATRLPVRDEQVVETR